jgi:hypothetical protein
MMVDLTLADRIEGCLLGGACGDALGAPVEFKSMPEIERRFGHGGIRDFEHEYGRTGAITDDTQMALFTLEGLLRAHVARHDRGNSDVPGYVHAAYKRWLRTQHEPYPALFHAADGWLIRHRELWSVRAPGNTCIHALKLDLPDGTPARNDSKGAVASCVWRQLGCFSPTRSTSAANSRRSRTDTRRARTRRQPLRRSSQPSYTRPGIFALP